MMKKRSLLLASLLSAALLSLPWLVPHTGAFALVAFVPLLCAERIFSLSGGKRFFLWHYLCFVLWNAFTTFWVCNATLGGGIAAVLANAFQMSVIFAAFRLFKRRVKGVLPYIFLAAMWIAWERFYFDAEISWPWLVLGNAFARSAHSVQWYEYTGTLGGSLWIWFCNLGIFGLMVALSDGSFSRWNAKARWSSAAGLALVLLAPLVLSQGIYHTYEQKSESKLDVLVVQPNFDPYEKFESLTQTQQNQIFAGLVKSSSGTADLIVAPETFTSDVSLNHPEKSPTLLFMKSLLSGSRTDMLLGASTSEVFTSASAPSPLALRFGKFWVERHNSAIVTDSTGRFEVFHKSKLVVGVEQTPFPKLFVPLDNKLGGVMGRCIGQDSVSLLHLNDGTAFGCAVCYESVFGEYCTEYVRKGARFLAVITNDAWWGDTPGYKQHLSYSQLRAIELRRDIARCANTGISAFIDQRGDIVSESSWWQAQTLRGEVDLNSELTFFARHGDVPGRICTLIFLLLSAFYLSSFFRRG